MDPIFGPPLDADARLKLIRELLGGNLSGESESARGVARHWRDYRDRLPKAALGRLCLSLAAIAGLPDDLAPERHVLTETTLRWADLEAARHARRKLRNGGRRDQGNTDAGNGTR